MDARWSGAPPGRPHLRSPREIPGGKRPTNPTPKNEGWRTRRGEVLVGGERRNELLKAFVVLESLKGIIRSRIGHLFATDEILPVMECSLQIGNRVTYVTHFGVHPTQILI